MPVIMTMGPVIMTMGPVIVTMGPVIVVVTVGPVIVGPVTVGPVIVIAHGTTPRRDRQRTPRWWAS